MIRHTSTLLLLLVIFMLAIGCTTDSPQSAGVAATPAGYTDLTPAQAKDLIETEKDLVVIDVSPYYDQGHLPGAISIPLGMLDEKIPSLDATKPYLVYCHGDGPSMAGAQKLIDAGFPRVYRLSGNYAAWVSAGYPVEK